MATYKKTSTPRSTTTTRGGSAGTARPTYKKTVTPRSAAAGAIKAATAEGRKEVASTAYKKTKKPR